MFKLQLRRHSASRPRSRGQSMVEMALTFPILLLVMAGTLEVGMYFNTYLNLLDATREAARYAADGDINLRDRSNAGSCNADYYNQAVCVLKQNLERYGVSFNEDTDDIVISALTIDTTGHVTYRFPYPCSAPYTPPAGYPQECDDHVDDRNQGWSYQRHRNNAGAGDARVRYSLFPNSEIEARLPHTGSPGSGLVIVEIYHVHHQVLGLIPPGLPFLPQEIVMHAYTIMPVPSAAPPLM